MTQSEGMCCPRRDESHMGNSYPGPDQWHIGPEGRTCSYCGCLHPQDLFTAIEAGCELGPTDKNYKVYVDLPNPNVGKPCVRGSANFEQKGEGWTQITPENRGSLPLDGWQRENFKDGHWVQVSPDIPKLHGKFYFQHLSPDDQKRFIDLYNARKMNIGMPGHFYSLPFFMRLGAAAEA